MKTSVYPSMIMYRLSGAQLYMLNSKKPLKIANLLAKKSPYYAQLLQQASLLERLNQLFVQMLSPSLRNHCRIAAINKDVLVCHVDSAAWATRLRYEQQTVLASLKHDQSLPPLRSIRIQVRPARGNPTRKILNITHPSAPVAEQAFQDAENITDPKLKKALQRLARRASKN